MTKCGSGGLEIGLSDYPGVPAHSGLPTGDAWDVLLIFAFLGVAAAVHKWVALNLAKICDGLASGFQGFVWDSSGPNRR